MAGYRDLQVLESMRTGTGRRRYLGGGPISADMQTDFIDAAINTPAYGGLTHGATMVPRRNNYYVARDAIRVQQ